MNIACITLLVASAMFTSTAMNMNGVGTLLSTKRSFSFAGVHDEPSPCADAEQDAETCLNQHDPTAAGLFEACVVEAEEEMSCETVAKCAAQSIQTNECDAETTAAFNCWGCGVCDQEGEDVVECIEGAGQEVEDVSACFADCFDKKDDPETCEAGCKILDKCHKKCLSKNCKSEVLHFAHCFLSHFGVDCTDTCPAQYHKSPVQSVALNFSRALKKNLRA
mmetsp:Transcript_11218/g.17054  ORF Transcript_11218/g.17054 Transcript_11218/m.17054 type:complete len:221 (-) Transcript_11218:176-838(-)